MSEEDERKGPVLTVFCQDKIAELYLGSLARLSNSRQLIRKPCLLHENLWISPNQFVTTICRMQKPAWKTVIKHNGVPLKRLLDDGIVVLDDPACYCEGCTEPGTVAMRNNLKKQVNKKLNSNPMPAKRPRLEESLHKEGWLSTQTGPHQSSTQGTPSARPKNHKCKKCEKAYIGAQGLKRHHDKYPQHRNSEDTSLSSSEAVNTPTNEDFEVTRPKRQQTIHTAGIAPAEAADQNVEGAGPSEEGTFSDEENWNKAFKSRNKEEVIIDEEEQDLAEALRLSLEEEQRRNEEERDIEKALHQSLLDKDVNANDRDEDTSSASSEDTSSANAQYGTYKHQASYKGKSSFGRLRAKNRSPTYVNTEQSVQPNQYGDAGPDARSPDTDQTLIKKESITWRSLAQNPTKHQNTSSTIAEMPQLTSSHHRTRRPSGTSKEECIEISDDETEGANSPSESNQDDEPMEIEHLRETAIQQVTQVDSVEEIPTEEDYRRKPETSQNVLKRTLVHFGLTREEEQSRETEDVDIYYIGNLVIPGDEGEEEDDMALYGTLLKNLYDQEYHQFLQHLLKKTPSSTDSNFAFDRNSVLDWITNLQMIHQTSLVVGGPPQVAELINGKLVLCIDDRIDNEGFIRQRISQQHQEVMAATTDSQPVEEDCYCIEPDESKQRKEPDPEKPAYRDSQRFLGENLLQRIKLIQEEMRKDVLEKLYDKFCFQIYTPRAKMLESQTKTRTMSADAECFSPEVYNSPKELFAAAEECVQILLTRTGSQKQTKAEKRHKELWTQAKLSPRTFFLIIADEAHWGPTSEARPDENADDKDETSHDRKAKKNPRAYSNLVNSWTDDDYPNVFVLLVSATPYNLLTKNTRLDLNKMCVWEENDGKRELRLATEIDATTKQVRLHHMKWEELIDYDIQRGVCKVLMIPLMNYNRYVYVDQNGIIKAEKKETKKFTKVHFKGPSSKEVRIQIIRNGKEEHLVVCEDLSKKRTSPDVIFLPSDELGLYESRLYTFKLTLHGMDVFHLETSDGKYMIHRREDGHGEDVSVSFYATEKSIDTSITDASIKRKDCFFAYEKQPENTLAPIDEYTSLNFYFNSLAEEKTFDAFLRDDIDFDKMANRILQENVSSKWDMYDILTAEYAIHMIHVFEIRECKLKENDLSQVLSAMHLACGRYTEKRETLISQFEEELQHKSESGDRNFSWIDPTLFQAVLNHLEERSKDALRDSLARFLYPDGHKQKDTDLDVCSYLVECLLFLRKSALDNFQEEIAETLYSDERYNDIFQMFSVFDFGKEKLVRVKENETCRLIDDLVLAKDNKPLHGSMKIVRMTTESGNKMYATLCLARKIASPKTHFTFEIVRDFDKFTIKHVQKKPDSSLYRIHQVLQCRDCSDVDKTTFERCPCTDQRGRFGPDLKCLECGHVHTTVKDYIDLKDLPCLVILVGKGRMGDTFPDNFNAMDLRVSTRDLKQPTLTPLVQEFGRLCCYGKKDDPGKMPYILLGKKLAETLVAKRKNFATLFGGFDHRHKDAYIESGNRAKETHADYENSYKHMNRILLEAEPQIGKTGVYLCLVSLLRKQIEGQQQEEQMELEEIDEEDTETNEVHKQTEAADWVRPFWHDMDEKLPILKKRIPTGKYVSLFGPYVYGSCPEKIVGTRDTSTKHRKTISTCQGVSAKFRTFPKNAPLTSTRSDARCTRKDYLIRVCGVESKLSVPTQTRFCPLFLKLHLDEELLERRNRIHEQSTDKDHQQLVTWIFTPSHGRCRRAYLNYDQTMRDSSGYPVKYVHVIVVRPTEYDSYVREWGLSHAVICLPPSLPEDEGVGPEGGGVGYARLFIQLMAQEYGLPAVFMLDDTIHSFCQVETRHQDAKEVVTEENGKHSFVPIPLFACLKDLELQLYDKDGNPPKKTGTFDAYPNGGVPHGTQESFTGPWAKYGIIGVLKNSQYVHTYKNPFKRTHVTSAMLVNIKALSDKNLKYKPWQVWEDLDMNNQCDDAGLWVVKYNKYVMRKVYISNWLPDYFEWPESTVMSQEPTPASKTNCLLALKKYVSHCCPMKKMEIVASEETDPCEDVRQLMGKLSTQNHGYHLVVVNDKNTTITDIQTSVAKAYSVNGGKVALLLPTRVCLNYNLTRKAAFQMMLGECIDGVFKFGCITSEDVSKKPVALVLLHIQVPRKDDAVDLETVVIRQDEVQRNTSKAAVVQKDSEDSGVVQQNIEDPGEDGITTVSNRQQEGVINAQSQQPSTSANSQNNSKSAIAQPNFEDLGEQGTPTISNREPKESVAVQSQQATTSHSSQGVKQCQKCETDIPEAMSHNWMENDSSTKQVLAEQAVDTLDVLLCDICVRLINQSRSKLTAELRQHREACRIRRELSNMSPSRKPSVQKNRLSLSRRRDSASSNPTTGTAGVWSTASATLSSIPQRMQVPRARTSTVGQQLSYGNHPQRAESTTPANIDSVLDEDLFLSQDF